MEDNDFLKWLMFEIEAFKALKMQLSQNEKKSEIGASFQIQAGTLISIFEDGLFEVWYYFIVCSCIQQEVC